MSAAPPKRSRDSSDDETDHDRPDEKRPTIGDLRPRSIEYPDEDDEEEEEEPVSESEEDPNFYSYDVQVPETHGELQDYKQFVEILQEAQREPGGMLPFGNVLLARIRYFQSASRELTRLAKKSLRDTKSNKLENVVDAFEEFYPHVDVWNGANCYTEEIVNSRLGMASELERSMKKAISNCVVISE